MELFGLEIGAWADFGVAFATLILAFITVLTVYEMRLQQKKDRLQKEMTLLVGPLRSRQDGHFHFGLWRNHRPSRDREEDTSYSKSYFNFWDAIMVNMYLGDMDLSSALQNYIDAKGAYWNLVGNHSPLQFDNTAEGRQLTQRFETTRSALRIETDRRYRNLRREINLLEERPLWQFWK
ncbi:MAG: hypothetical protein WCP70_09805 [Methanothrix sp.]